jgi:Integrase core domain
MHHGRADLALLRREIRNLIRQLSSANPLWGAPRIHGELLKLGIEVSQATVAKYMVRRRGNTFSELEDLPAQSRRGHRCDRYVRCGVRIVPAALRDGHSCPRSQEDHAHSRHRAPDRSWLSRQVTEAFPWDTAPRYLLRDRDASYGSEFHSRVEAMNIAEVVTAPRSPWQNAYVERVIGSIRRECLDHLVIFNKRHLRRVLSSYVTTTNAPARIYRSIRIARLPSDSASQHRKRRRHPKSQWLASSLRTSGRLSRPRFRLTDGCAAPACQDLRIGEFSI